MRLFLSCDLLFFSSCAPSDFVCELSKVFPRPHKKARVAALSTVRAYFAFIASAKRLTMLLTVPVESGIPNTFPII